MPRWLRRRSIAASVKVLTEKDSAMAGIGAYEIGIVDYPGAQAACVLGLTDLFGVACPRSAAIRVKPAARDTLGTDSERRCESFLRL